MNPTQHPSGSHFEGGALANLEVGGTTPATMVKGPPMQTTSHPETRTLWNPPVKGNWSSRDPALPSEVGGHLALCSKQWEEISASPTILNMIAGVNLEFSASPPLCIPQGLAIRLAGSVF